MKKLLFIHSGEKIKKDDKNNLYTDGSYNSEIWKRYFWISKDITVLFREDSKIYDYGYCQDKFNILDDSIRFQKLENTHENIISFFSIKKRYYNKMTMINKIKECDIVIIRVPSSSANIAIKNALKYKKKLIVEVVGCSFDALWNKGIKGKIMAIPSFFQMKHYVKIAPNVIYVTNSFLQKRYPNFKNNIGCSDVEINNLDEIILKKRLDKLKDKSNNLKMIIGTCGGIDVEAKGHKYVFYAIKKLKEQGIINIEYQLVGNGNKHKLLKLAQKLDIVENIKFLGSVPHDKIFEWMDNIDIYIQPSCQEGLCRSIIEAMSRGCPCIASNAGGNPELISNKYIFIKRNIKDLTNKIKLIMNENLDEIAQKNFEKAKLYEKKVLDSKRNKFLIDTIN